MTPGWGRRVAAWTVDAGLGVVLAVVISSTLGITLTERSAVMFQVGTPDTIWKGPIPMMLGLLGPFVYAIPLALLLVRASAPLFGASPGQALLGIMIARSRGEPDASAPDSAAPIRQRVLRFLLEHLEWIGFVLGLVSGRWEVAAAGIAGGLIRVLARLGGRRLVDEWTGTRLVRLVSRASS